MFVWSTAQLTVTKSISVTPGRFPGFCGEGQRRNDTFAGLRLAATGSPQVGQQRRDQPPPLSPCPSIFRRRAYGIS